MKTSDLSGPALEWVVASIEYPRDSGILNPDLYMPSDYQFTTDWSQGGPIIEREKIDLLSPGKEMPPMWGAWSAGQRNKMVEGPTPLIAAMRCFVASKLGDEVDVPMETL